MKAPRTAIAFIVIVIEHLRASPGASDVPRRSATMRVVSGEASARSRNAALSAQWRAQRTRDQIRLGVSSGIRGPCVGFVWAGALGFVVLAGRLGVAPGVRPVGRSFVGVGAAGATIVDVLVGGAASAPI